MVKVNTNIVASPADLNLTQELKKLKAVFDAGVDAVMDLTVFHRSSGIHKEYN